MTPEEKAKDLVDKFMDVLCNDRAEDVNWFYLDRATQCAIIAVEEIIEAIKLIEKDYYDGYFSHDIKEYNQVLTHLKNKS